MDVLLHVIYQTLDGLSVHGVMAALEDLKLCCHALLGKASDICTCLQGNLAESFSEDTEWVNGP